MVKEGSEEMDISNVSIKSKEMEDELKNNSRNNCIIY